MPYSTLTFPAAKNELAARLQDAGKVFWDDAELGEYLKESLRCWQAYTRSQRERGTFQTDASVAWYSIPAKLSALCGYTLKDRDLAGAIQRHLLEPYSPTAWTGSDQLSMSDVVGAIQKRRDQFLLETGAVVTRDAAVAMPPAPSNRVQVSETVIDVRRVVYRDPDGQRSHLWQADEEELNAFRQGWSVNSDRPLVYSRFAMPTATIQVAPVPADTGQLEILTVNRGAVLDVSAGVLLGVPDDFAWVVKWGALADLLGRDGYATDPARAQYCEARWQQGIQAARSAGLVLNAELNGIPVEVESVFSLDAFLPAWENSTGTPGIIGVAGLNLVCVADEAPDSGTYSVTMDVVRNAPVPAADTDYLQIGQEHVDVILDYAQHLAAFKMGGAEFEATGEHYQRFVRAASLQNERLAGMAEFAEVLTGKSQTETQDRPPRRKGRQQ